VTITVSTTSPWRGDPINTCTSSNPQFTFQAYLSYAGMGIWSIKDLDE
jgi:hypothetical protein